VFPLGKKDRKVVQARAKGAKLVNWGRPIASLLHVICVIPYQWFPCIFSLFVEDFHAKNMAIQ